MSSVPSHDEAIFSVSSGHSSQGGKPAIPRSSTGLSSRIRRRFTSPQSHLGSRPNRDSLRPPPTPEPEESEGNSRRGSQWAVSELNRLIGDEEYDLDTYGLTEFRDGFFDAAFTKLKVLDPEELAKRAERTLPRSLQKRHPLSLTGFLPKQWRGAKDVAVRVFTTRGGIKLMKTFLGVYIAYVLCLVTSTRNWLGPHSYIMVVSAIINHPGRAVGSQLDGCVSTILGAITGLGWGAFGLWLSTSTDAAKIGYGAILAMFLAIYIGFMAVMRAYFIRLYQFVISAGIAVCYTILSEQTDEMVRWAKLRDYGVPWLLGQALCLVVCVVVFPDAGARSLAVSINTAFGTMLEGLDEQKAGLTPTKRRLAQTFVNLSQAYRDLVIDFTVTLFDPKDVFALRNLLQAIVRGLLAIRPKPEVFHLHEIAGDHVPSRKPNVQAPKFSDTGVELDTLMPVDEVFLAAELGISPLDGSTSTEQAVLLVCYNLEDPTSRLITRMKQALQACHAVLMEMSGYRKYLGPGEEVSADLLGALVKLRKAMLKFDAAEDALLGGEEVSSIFVKEVVEVFAYCRPIRQAAKAIEAALVKVMEMEQRKPSWPRVYPPSYPLKKFFNRTNKQVRHDRGGVTAGSYYRSFQDISRLIQKIKSSAHHPEPQQLPEEPELFNSTSAPQAKAFEGVATRQERGLELKKSTIRFSIWKVLHRLQGFEMRFALKNIIVMVLLSLPAWLAESRGWWNNHASWWAVAMAWTMMHPRVGGNFQDLVTRAFTAVLGAIWSGAGYAAGNGSPCIMGVFAAIYLLPMLYRFTQSSHPRSGLVGCLSFTVTSLTLMSGVSSPVTVTVARGVAFAVGVVAAIVINWILWPFVARHELRKAMSAMLFFLSIVYRSIVAKYIYYEQGHKPTAEDIQRSEILEGRLREGFVRIRQLMGLTRHEIRLRARFDPLPYSALADSCERFFELLVAVRESALYFDPKFARDNEDAISALLNYRRDAVASILTNLYILAGALRANRKVPKYLPSAAVARKRLMDKMIELEEEYELGKGQGMDHGKERKKWVQIYSYSYNESLTGCVAQLEELERYTKAIVGEQGFEYQDSDEEE